MTLWLGIFEISTGKITAANAVRDDGTPFDPPGEADPDVTLSAEERPVGGLGIFLVKKTMDEVTYRREKDQNVLTVKKKLR